MQIYSQLAPLALGGAHGSAVAMGFFDGIHIGHRAVINGAVEWAKAHGAAPAVFTFRLPTENKMKGKRLLSTEDKHALIASLGVEHYLCPATPGRCSAARTSPSVPGRQAHRSCCVSSASRWAWR